MIGIIFLVFIVYILNIHRDRIYNLNGAQIVFLGNSHIQSALNDNIISNSRNFAREAEVPEYMYYKLRNLKKYNSKLDTVVVCFDNWMIYNGGDYWGFISPTFYDRMSLRDILAILKYGDERCITHHLSHPFFARKMIDHVYSFLNPNFEIRNAEKLGGFKSYEGYVKDIVLRKNDFHEIKKDSDVKQISLYFYKRIYEFCKENGMTLVFICPPQYKLLTWDPHHFYDFAVRHFPDVPFLNFIEAQMPENCYEDLDHLNVLGADVFSKFLEDSILHRPIRNIHFTDSIK